MRARLAVPRVILAVAAGILAITGAKAPSARAETEGPKVQVVVLRGDPVKGGFSSLTEREATLSGSAAPIALDGVREIRFAADSDPAPAAVKGVLLRVSLRGDEVVRGVFVSGNQDGIEVRPSDLPAIRLPFDRIRRIEAEAAYKGPCDDPTRERPALPGKDIAYTRSGDSFRGIVVGAGEAGLAVEDAAKQTSTVAWTDLLLAHLDVPALPAPTGFQVEVETLAGTLLPATKVTGDAASGLKVTSRAGLEVVVPVAAVRVVRFTGGRFVYASSLPYEWTYTPYYAEDPYFKSWNATRSDRTPHACPLRVAGVTYRHGISVHARSAVTVPLHKGFASFEAKFGIDDEALEGKDGLHGDVTSRVTADGKEVWKSGGSVKGGEAARPVGPIDVTGVEVLVLEVDFGAEKHVNDRADWVDPVLAK